MLDQFHVKKCDKIESTNLRLLTAKYLNPSLIDNVIGDQ